MPKDITDLETFDSFRMGVYEKTETDPERELTAIRIVDITDICGKLEMGNGQAVIKYAKAGDEEVIFVEQRSEQDERVGIRMHAPIGSQEDYADKNDVAFMAGMLGCSVLELAETIYEFIPKPESY